MTSSSKSDGVTDRRVADQCLEAKTELTKQPAAHSKLRRFFLAPDSALNLAFFRIVLTATLFCHVDLPTISFCSSIPADLLTIPAGGAAFLKLLPLSPAAAVDMAHVCRWACVFGLIGLFTRTSLLVATVCGAYALLVPHLLTGSRHDQHLIWFCALLACSRSGDALSIDALIKARYGKGINLSRLRDWHYGLPLRCVWLLMGILFFFPGMWKLILHGRDWVFADGLRQTIYFKWASLGGWISSLRLDRLPYLYRAGGACVICFELSFILLVLFRKTRIYAVVLGLAFHNLTNLVMHIPFWQLQTCYAALIDWQRHFIALGRRIFKTRCYVTYASDCSACVQSVSAMRAFDLLRRVCFLDQVPPVKNGRFLDLHWVMQFPSENADKQLSLILRRLPLIWPLHLLLPLRSVRDWLRKGHRTLGLVSGAQPANQWGFDTFAICSVGAALLVFNSFFGLKGNERGWPFCCYPIYNIQSDTIERLGIMLVFADGHKEEADLDRTFISLSNYENRFWRYSWPALNASSAGRVTLLNETWQLLLQERPQWKEASRVCFYKEICSTNPANYSTAPDKILLYELSP